MKIHSRAFVYSIYSIKRYINLFLTVKSHLEFEASFLTSGILLLSKSVYSLTHYQVQGDHQSIFLSSLPLSSPVHIARLKKGICYLKLAIGIPHPMGLNFNVLVYFTTNAFCIELISCLIY